MELKIEDWNIKLDSPIKYITSIEKNFTYILTENYFVIYDKSKDSLIKYQIPENIDNNIDTKKIGNFNENKIWLDKLGIHIIFKLYGITYYYNNIFPEKKKIKQLKLFSDEKKEYIEPISLSFNNINENIKNTDEIIFTDENSGIYLLNIKIENNLEITEKIIKIYDINNNIEKINNNNNEDELNKILFSENNNNLIEKDDRIYDIKLFIKEEKQGTGRKIKIIKNYFIIAITKRTIFQLKGKNTINDVFSNNKNIFSESKIFPKVSRVDIPRLQIYKSKFNKKNYFSWNNDIGFIFWEIILEEGIPKPIKEFNLYEYIKIKNEEKKINIYPISCISSSRCIYYLYDNCFLILNTLTNNIIYKKYFNYKEEKEKYIDMYYNPNMNRIILYSENKIKKISLEHEYNNLWKDYIQIGEYNLALQYYPKDDENFKEKLRKLNAEFLFGKKHQYDSAGMEYALSNENFEHICLKFFDLNDINYLINYLNLLNKLKIANLLYKEENKEENNDKDNNNNKYKDKYFIQKYLINTWLLELILEKEDNNNNKDNKTLRQLIFESGYIDSKYYIDKLIIFNLLRNYGRREDFVDFAGLKEDYKEIVFDLVNHNKFKEAIKNIISYMSYSDDEKYLKNLIKIFLMYINIFVKESPEEVIELLDKYYFLLENPKEIIRIISNFDEIYNNKMNEEIFEKILNLIKKFKILAKNNKNKIIFDESLKQNIYNLYILYLSKSIKEEHFNELNEYLKSLIKEMNKYTNKNKNIIYFDFSFADNLFKKRNNKQALALLYCLKKQYNKSILYSFKCKNDNTSIFIANNIPNHKKQKEIWLSLFNYYKKIGIKKVEELLQKSNGILTITDILPHLMGNVQLKDIENNLNKCIDEYEIKLRKLKNNIKEFSLSEEILNKKIAKINNFGQKNLRFNFENINCTICLKNLKENNFYLFPCGHAFDFDCLINALFYYDNKKIGTDKFKNKMNSIKKIFYATKEVQKKQTSIIDKKLSLNIGYVSKSENLKKGFFKSLTLKNNFDNINNINDTKIISSMLEGLDDLLNEECPLCGNEIILDTQAKFGNEDINWQI